jgi:hypothetical protein
MTPIAPTAVRRRQVCQVAQSRAEVARRPKVPFVPTNARLEQVAEGALQVVAELRHIFQLDAAGAVKTELGEHVAVDIVQGHYFDGHEVLWKSLKTQMEEAVHMVDERTIDFDNLSALQPVPCSSSFSSRSPRSEVEAIKKLIEPRAILKSLVNEAKVAALKFIGREEAAYDLLAAELHSASEKLN